MTPIRIDISHILGWQGRLTGIERVEYHLIQHYFNLGEESVIFVAWDPSLGYFVEVSHSVVGSDILNRASVAAPEAVNLSPAYIKRIIKRLDSKINKFKRERTAEHAPSATTKGEQFLVLAGLWDKEGYIESLKLLEKRGVQLFHVVYDMIPILQPQYMVDFLPPIFEHYMLEVLPLCTGILSISESTARDTKEVLKSKRLNTPPIKAFRLGDDIPAKIAEQRPAGINGDFFLSVSTIEARKNHTIFFYLYKLAIQKGIELPQLLIVGKRGWNTADFQYLVEHDPEIKEKIRILDNIEDSELNWLYKNSKAVIFPSFYEGWGLPIAEALYYEKVVLCADTSSLPEVGGELAYYFSPFSPEQLLDSIEQYILNPKTLLNRENEVKTKYKPTSWQQAAKDFDKKLKSLS
jgi:glycosyltransferase involved in cell wall biosynthesis